jgi:uncharacterized repeat protein (TIGR01451 family)
VDNPTPEVGLPVTFTATVGNNGPDAATGVVVRDLLPPGLAFAGATSTQGPYDPNLGVWFVGTLPAGGAAELVVTAIAVGLTPVANVAVVRGDQFDPDLANNSAGVAVFPHGPFPDVMPSDPDKLGLLGSGMGDGGPALVPDALFVNGLYHDVLGRTADQAGLDGWVDSLLAGVSPEAVAAAFWESPEHRGLEVDQFYQAFLHRAADPAGRAFWVGALLAGFSEEQIEAAILGSLEYSAEHPSAALFVMGLYADVLGRAADPAGLAFWQGQLQSGLSHQAVALGFLQSAEGATREVNALYEQALKRPADPVGLGTFVPALAGGAPWEVAADALFASGEYLSLPH